MKGVCTSDKVIKGIPRQLCRGILVCIHSSVLGNVGTVCLLIRTPMARHTYQVSSKERSAFVPSQSTLSIAPFIMEKCGTVCPMSISQMTGISGNAVRIASS